MVCPELGESLPSEEELLFAMYLRRRSLDAKFFKSCPKGKEPEESRAWRSVGELELSTLASLLPTRSINHIFLKRIRLLPYDS